MRNRFLLSLATAGLAAGILASTASAAPMEVALQDDNVFLRSEGIGRNAGLQRAVQLRAKSIRINLSWGTIDRVRGRYDFRRFDAGVNAARRRGLKVQATLTGVPWGKVNGRKATHNPSVAGFAEFSRQAARHFRGRIARYSIWNEPNLHHFLSPQWRGRRNVGAEKYRALFIAASRAIRSVDRRAQILIGETGPYARTKGQGTPPLLFLRNVTCRDKRMRAIKRCAPLKAHGYAHHPYELLIPAGSDNVSMRTLGRLSSTLRKLARVGALRTPAGRVPGIYLTEFGYPVMPNRPVRRLSPGARAAYLAASMRRANRNPLVRQVVLYQLASFPSNPGGRLWDSGIVFADNRPQASFTALVSWARRAKAAGTLR